MRERARLRGTSNRNIRSCARFRCTYDPSIPGPPERQRARQQAFEIAHVLDAECMPRECGLASGHFAQANQARNVAACDRRLFRS